VTTLAKPYEGRKDLAKFLEHARKSQVKEILMRVVTDSAVVEEGGL